MTDEAAAQGSDRRLGLLVVLAGVALIGVIVAVAIFLGGSKHGTVVEKKTEYVTCRDSGSQTGARSCTTEHCPRIEYLTDEGRRKGTCVSKALFDRLHVGDPFSE